jgi:hypothetical protein
LSALIISRALSFKELGLWFSGNPLGGGALFDAAASFQLLELNSDIKMLRVLGAPHAGHG